MDDDRKTERRAVVALVLTGAVGVWAALLALGFKGQMDRMSTPGPESSVPDRFPDGAPFRPAAAGSTLVLFAHPRCPCTPESLRRLGERVARSGGAVDLHVAFFRPAGAGPEWSSGAAWDAARALPGARLHGDDDGALARRFGARTSGLLVVYGPDGALRFRGGLTPGRGAGGPSAGDASLDAVLSGSRPSFDATPVFGCAIFQDAFSGKGP